MSPGVDAACRAAEAAFDAFRETPPQSRASLLEAIALRLEHHSADIVASAHAETALPVARLQGELGRTTGQLRFFAFILREGSFAGVQFDSPLPERLPAPRPDLRQRRIGVGPVAVFGASNFPLAFSVAGGDTASALAAGCPVVCKAHSGHPETSRLVAIAIGEALQAQGFPAGIFSLVTGSVGADLVAHPAIRAVGFTGSRHGGTALLAIAQSRRVPIPMYAEMSSINPVLLFPGALKSRGASIAADFVASLTLGVGQFCTNPGLVLLPRGTDGDAFRDAAVAALSQLPAGTMLTDGICEAYGAGVAAWENAPGVRALGRGAGAAGIRQGLPALFEVSMADFLAQPMLQQEVFGPAGLLVRCEGSAGFRQVLQALEGQLTVALHMDATDHADAHELLPLLERLAGRILVNGFGTGVEVAHAMVHGGPWPATSDSRTTSVGALALERFLRPVCYQNFPAELLPEALRDGNPWNLPRRRDGRAAQ
ncbi:MAG: aldehyde dehydrogenase (NADP(+)) [Proteobacteria bacterium]|nr:aldehyde dehydrogenase (NADP(+)) [Pseudomonadota bacterium]